LTNQAVRTASCARTHGVSRQSKNNQLFRFPFLIFDFDFPFAVEIHLDQPMTNDN
jgi:hypothetical protein